MNFLLLTHGKISKDIFREKEILKRRGKQKEVQGGREVGRDGGREGGRKKGRKEIAGKVRKVKCIPMFEKYIKTILLLWLSCN